MSYTIINDIIYTNTCELNVVHHCNLSCRSCGHFSPILEKYYISPTKVFEDLSILAKYYRCEHVRLLGGEPLLHPNLIDVIDAVLRSGVSNRIRLVTNGLLLWKMTDTIWKAIDEVHISVYPGREMTAKQLELCQQKAQLHNVKLEFLYFDHFRESHAELGTSDKELVRRIYKTCQMAHHWRCYNVHEGYFYKCPESIFIPRFLKNDKLSEPTIDGVKIVDSPTLANDLLAYIESPLPLESCQYCLGSVGKLFPHEQVSRKNWKHLQQYSTENLIDLEYLSILENQDPDADNLCLRSHVLDPENSDRVGSELNSFKALP